MADKDTDTVVRKRSDAYTGFLAISFLAMVGATVLMYLEYQNYDGKAPPKAPTIDVPGAQLKQLPGSGAPPKIEPKPPADAGPGPGPGDNPPMDVGPKKDMPMGRRAPAPPADALPSVLPPMMEDTVPIILPPTIDPMPSEFVPTKADEYKPIVPVIDPSDDAPPLPKGKRPSN